MIEVEKYRFLGKIVLDEAKQNDAYAIVRVQNRKYVGIKIINGNTEEIADTPEKGIGIHVFTREGYSGFASTSRLDNESARTMTRLAIKSAKDSAKHKGVKRDRTVFELEGYKNKHVQDVKYKIDDKTLPEQEAVVKTLNEETKALDERLSVTSTYRCLDEEWLIMRSDGTDVVYTMPYSAIYQLPTAKEGEHISETLAKVNGIGLDVLLDDDKRHLHDKRVRNAVKIGLELLKAGKIKGGNYKAVLSYNFLGLFAHEAVGHGVESDFMKTTIFSRDGVFRKGEKVAPSNISYIDGPISGIWGNQFMSDNGFERKRVTFIKDGVLTDALSDVFSAKDAGVEINGCGRAQFYHNIPIPRMSNTWIEDSNPYPLEKSFDDIVLDDVYEMLVRHGELKKGEKVVYPVIGAGGQVSPSDGTFMFNCAGIYLIENPKKFTLYKSSSFSGDILGTIKTGMRGVGKDLCLDDIGVCGKEGQGAPVSNGGNPLFIVDKSDSIIFGGG